MIWKLTFVRHSWHWWGNIGWSSSKIKFFLQKKQKREKLEFPLLQNKIYESIFCLLPFLSHYFLVILLLNIWSFPLFNIHKNKWREITVIAFSCKIITTIAMHDAWSIWKRGTRFLLCKGTYINRYILLYPKVVLYLLYPFQNICHLENSVHSQFNVSRYI